LFAINIINDIGT
jgi:hypothetical protein